MGMLLHHTWLEQQKNAEKPVEKKQDPATEEVAKETEEPEAAPKRTGGRRKTK